MTEFAAGAGKTLVRTSLAAATLCAATPASAQIARDYSYEFTPYLWGANLNGDTSVGGLPTAHVEAKFSDLLENLDFGAMFIFEMKPRNGHSA